MAISGTSNPQQYHQTHTTIGTNNISINSHISNVTTQNNNQRKQTSKPNVNIIPFKASTTRPPTVLPQSEHQLTPLSSPPSHQHQAITSTTESPTTPPSAHHPDTTNLIQELTLLQEENASLKVQLTRAETPAQSLSRSPTQPDTTHLQNNISILQEETANLQLQLKWAETEAQMATITHKSELKLILDQHTIDMQIQRDKFSRCKKACQTYQAQLQKMTTNITVLKEQLARS
jgi:hypothetical protein